MAGLSPSYEKLANKIIEVAIDDFKAALIAEDTGKIKSLKRFFYGPWYAKLTDVDPDYLLHKIAKEMTGDDNQGTIPIERNQ